MMHQHPFVAEELVRQRHDELRRCRRPWRDRAPSDLASLLEEARRGDERAWESLIGRFSGAMRATARGYGLSATDVDDAVQSAWTTAYRRLSTLRDPEAIGGWMKTITAREALHTAKKRRREILVDDPDCHGTADPNTPEDAVLDAMRDQAVRAAVDRLPSRQRGLIRLLLDGTERSYDELSGSLGMPTGSLGPTRQRALARLRRDPRLLGQVAP